MKKTFSKFLLLLVAVIMFCCSDEPIVPGDPELTEDLATSASAYSPDIFVAEITTTQPGPNWPVVPVSFHMMGSGGKVSINWGDGTIEKVTITSYLEEYSHQYDRVKNYTIKIDGDIKNIEYYGMSYQDGVRVRNLHLSGLTGLKTINLVIMTEAPEVINLSHNKLLEEIDFVDLTTLKQVIVPTTNKLTAIRLTGCTQLSTAAMDHIIGRVYQSVVSTPRTGSFSASMSWYDEGTMNEMIGPPSSYSINKLRKLRDSYGWSVYPGADL
ncbi:hypothetical protein KK083_25975 [Fulvivirgaceae bacterium PWU4]|uniref:Leucine-rich repeat domain-containing protein n=1 Tax=Chryseosolibacter histidini TaxID=2782349 RepID=A0AAP2DSQ7_9BACT|nr:hypothetical protein [Chryseosolibacter histidini]MBT1700362.1 hypothetical protein [Chryseosolibacter histidini]